MNSHHAALFGFANQNAILSLLAGCFRYAKALRRAMPALSMPVTRSIFKIASDHRPFCPFLSIPVHSKTFSVSDNR